MSPSTVTSPLAVCARLAHEISRTERLDDIYAAALDALEAGLNVTRASILLFDPDGVMRFKAWRGISDMYRAAVEGHTPWTPGEMNASPVVVADVTRDDSLREYLPTFDAEGISAMAFIPLNGSDGVMGKFMLYYAEPHDVSSDELQVADLIAAQVAFAVERTRAYIASARLAAIVAYSDDAIVSKNLDGIIESWNRGAERMFGYPASEAIGRHVTIIIPPEFRAEEDRVLALVRSDEPVELETTRCRKDGSRLEISLKVSPVKDAHGRIIGASKIARDITARRRDEAQHAELQRRLTMLVTASASLLDSPETDSVRAATLSLARQLLVADGYAMWVTDPKRGAWHIVRSEGVSASFANRIIDWYQGERAPSTPTFSQAVAIEDVTNEGMVSELVPAYRAEGIQSMLVCPMRLGAQRSGTLVFYYRTRHSFTESDVHTGQALANLSAAALTTAELYEHQRSARDAAEHARRQAAFLADATAILSQSLDYEQTLAAVAQLAVPEIADWCAVHIVNHTGDVQRLAVTHFDASKLALARTLEEHYPPDPEMAGGVHHVIKTGQPAMLETIPPEMLTASARDAEHLRLLRTLALGSYMCVPLISTAGTFGAITFVFAESGRHYSSGDLAFARELAARAALGIENAFAYRRAHDANRLKDEFLANLSHELRTPLNAILGYAQMLDQGVLSDDKEARAITVLTRNAESLRQIIEDVLDVSRITSGKLRLNVRSVDVGEILRNAAATVQPAADAKGVQLNVTVDADVPTMSGDPDRLQQIVWNLLSNSVKFTPGGGHVDLRLDRVDAFAEIVVRDDGQGIDPTFLPHIFERFRQGDSRFSREHGGLGLGLSIVRDLAELHGGTVSAVSAGLGAGATFTVRLPIRA